ncbi:MAG TPA: GNAT family N-acetyltransferase [Polyangiaceae bacterium]|nr:GNAT family N-acetyltransferase [Polyangiaceae bacterium]
MTVQIRKATRRDLPKIAKLAGELVRQHYGFDPKRFMFIAKPEAGYEWWFGKELSNKKALIYCATLEGRKRGRGPALREIVGYAYARLEPRDWNSLLDAHGALHDVLVAESARRRGIAKKLLERVLAELRERGAPRVVLHTSVRNPAAQKLFASVGFRKTMLEMTCEL